MNYSSMFFFVLANYSEKSLGISVIYTDETFNPRDNQVKTNHVTSVSNGNIYPPLAMKSNGHAFHKRHTMEDLYVVQEEDELSEGNTRKGEIYQTHPRAGNTRRGEICHTHPRTIPEYKTR